MHFFSEGELETIDVTPFESSPLNPGYVRSRIAIATGKPLNINRLQEALQILQLNPLISRISAELSDGSSAGKSRLKVQYETVSTFDVQVYLDNNRPSSIGNFQRSARLLEDNLWGWGDRFTFDYRNTDGSDEFETSYEIPFNPYNGSTKFRYRTVNSKVITEPFSQFDIQSDYQQFEITLRQPLLETVQQEFALGLSLDRQENHSKVGGLGFPLSPGSNLEGETNITTLRFFQEWVSRNPESVIAVRSSLNFGVDVLGTTEAFDASVNPFAPKSDYFMWRGQAQWVRSLGTDSIFLIRGDLQVSQDPLVPVEQFSYGGFGTVRGYFQNTRLTDSGLVLNAEARLLLYRDPNNKMLLQLIPFVDYGVGWNVEEPVPTPDSLASIRLGLLWQYKWLTARIDWGIPLSDIDSNGNTLQEEGIYFSITISPF